MIADTCTCEAPHSCLMKTPRAGIITYNLGRTRLTKQGFAKPMKKASLLGERALGHHQTLAFAKTQLHGSLIHIYDQNLLGNRKY